MFLETKKELLEIFKSGKPVFADLAREYQSKDRSLSEKSHNAVRKQISKLYYSEYGSSLEDDCESYDIPTGEVERVWKKDKDITIQYKPEQPKGITEDDIQRAVHSALKDFSPKVTPTTDIRSNIHRHVYIADPHVGLDPDSDNLFNNVYNKNVFFDRLDHVYTNVTSMPKVDQIDIMLMGDSVDGYNGYTTRGGHKLRQNLNTREQFDVFVEGFVNLVGSLAKSGVANRFGLRGVTNSNHGGAFEYCCLRAVQIACENMFDNVECSVYSKFIEHHVVGDHCFLITHGKDETHMFKGFPAELNANIEVWLHNYIRAHKLTSKYKFIHLVKGDSHQYYHKIKKSFSYFSFPAFAPSSGWVSTNFSDQEHEGYVISDIDPYKFDITHKLKTFL